ncbi:MAG: radical SAM family heme chaperone HemW [Acidimicrobiia bacterium]|nr:radical SAM family heme chaperone HemW [Acidimicrobiia bacterium]
MTYSPPTPLKRFDQPVPSAYIHIPFCSRVCPYCDFAVVAGADDLIDRYVSAVVSEIRRAGPWRTLGAVYIGGGTPSHIPPDRLGEILAALQDVVGIESAAEVSMEANPEDWEPAVSNGFRAAGANRVSFGAQSLNNSELVFLGRRHGPREVTTAVRAARNSGFERVSVDLIFGSPIGSPDGGGLDHWETSLRGALDLGIDHLSCYALTVEQGTPFSRAVKRGAPAPDGDIQADMWELAESLAPEFGLDRYEVSNWSEPGSECLYNLAVWAQGEYLAYGNGARRFVDGERSRNYRRLDAYLDAIEGVRSPVAGKEQIDGWDAELERIFLGMRRATGVAHGPGVDALLTSAEGARLVAAGVVDLVEGRLLVTRPLLTDMVERVVLDMDPPSGTVHSRVT